LSEYYKYYGSFDSIINDLVSKQIHDAEIKDLEEIMDLFKLFQENLAKNLNQDNSINSLEYNKYIKDSYMSKTISVFVDKFSSIPKSISNLRSNFIPIEIINSNVSQQNLGATDIGGDATYHSDDFSKKESYENAFMRILGMPESNDIGPDEEIFIVDENFNLKKIKFSTLFSADATTRSSSDGLDILDERQRNFSNRKFKLGPSDIESVLKSLNPSTKTTSNIEGQNVDPLQSEEVSLISINDDHDLLKKVTYLKCLPIQDSRYLRCINEPGKIISKPFDENIIKVVNKEDVKVSFLENIIRLRLDKISGRIYGDDIDDDTGVKTPVSIYDENNINSFSVIEQLLLERLTDMIPSLSQQYYSLLKKFIDDAKK